MQLTIGADPEFVIVNDDGFIVRATDYGNLDTKIGADGEGNTFECRPAPSENPLEVFDSLKRSFNWFLIRNHKLLKFHWFSSPFAKNKPLGGHIHFGFDEQIRNKWANSLDLQKCAHSFLGYYLGSNLLFFEDVNESAARRDRGYGIGFSFREQRHGVEYRQPSSWLFDPRLAKAALCLAKVVFADFLDKFGENHNREMNYWISENYGDKLDAKNSLERFSPELPNIWDGIAKMALYEKYREEISFLKTPESALSAKESFHPRWGMSKPKTLIETVTFKKIWN